MRIWLAIGMAVLVQGCDDTRPAGEFGYGSQADAQLSARLRQRGIGTGGTVATGAVPVTQTAPAPIAPVSSGPITTSPIGATPTGQPVGALPQTAPGAQVATGDAADPQRRGGVQASPGNAAPTLVGGSSGNGALSDEQSFDAVSSRETIESDAQRRAAQAAAYQVVQPEALPTRTTNTGPNIVQYALSTSHSKGQQLHTRVLGSQSRMARSCASYPSADAAQRAFLSAGGPERDRYGMDPDGDGFACAWDPAPYRLAAQR